MDRYFRRDRSVCGRHASDYQTAPARRFKPLRQRFVRETEIHAPVRAVFAFHERPDALVRLTPPGDRIDVIQPPTSLAVGTHVIFRVHLGPIAVVWEAEHTEYERDKVFADLQIRGPFRYWLHRHRFESTATGTRLIDDIEYELPAGALGRLIAGGAIRAKLEAMFAHRHAVTRAACETSE